MPADTDVAFSADRVGVDVHGDVAVGVALALALMFLKLHAQGYNISMVLFGSYNLLVSYLIFRSTFMPRVLAMLLSILGLCYLINCFANFLLPGFAAHLLPYILVPGGGEYCWSCGSWWSA